MTNQNARRRHTTNPRYGHKGGLPSVYPYKRILSYDEAAQIATYLCKEIGGGESLSESYPQPYWFAITGHSKSADGHVTLWLSVNAALFLQRIDLISYVDETGDTDK